MLTGPCAVWVYVQRPVRVDRNASAMGKPNPTSDFNVNFAHRNPRPGEKSLQCKRGNHFAAIIKEQRHARLIRVLRQVSVARSRDEAQIFVWLTSNAGEGRQIATPAAYVHETGDLGWR